jgi:hypothetical protein
MKMAAGVLTEVLIAMLAILSLVRRSLTVRRLEWLCGRWLLLWSTHHNIRSTPQETVGWLTTMAECRMDEQLKSRFEKVLEHYAGVIKERDDALIREKAAREIWLGSRVRHQRSDQFEASFRTVVDRVILPAAEQVKELVTPKNWICRATKADNALSAKIEIYQGNMKATTGERPHVKISAAAKGGDVQIYLASQSSGGSKQSVTKVGK